MTNPNQLEHSYGFCASAQGMLAAENEPSGIYRLYPEHEAHRTFLAFFKEELEQLPFDGERGRVVAREDARSLTGELVAFVGAQILRLESGEQWDEAAGSGFDDAVNDSSLELFKNIILPGGEPGIGYSVDLGSIGDFDERRRFTDIAIDRYYIQPDRTRVKGRRDGSLLLNCRRGRLQIDLVDEPLGHLIQDLPDY